MDFIPSSIFRQKISNYLKFVKKDRKYILITKRNEVIAVLVNPRLFVDLLSEYKKREGKTLLQLIEEQKYFR